MQFSIKGKQIDVGDALREHATTTLTHTLDKYFDKSIEAAVTLSREAHLIRVQISAHVGRGILVQAHHEASDPYVAFDGAHQRLDKQLRRYKRRLRDHHKAAHAEAELLPAQQYILQGNADQEDDSVEVVADQPIVIAELATKIASLTVSEAVMRMDLADQDVLMFRNRAHGGLNTIYRRSDGNIGWIDPDGNPSA